MSLSRMCAYWIGQAAPAVLLAKGDNPAGAVQSVGSLGNPSAAWAVCMHVQGQMALLAATGSCRAAPGLMCWLQVPHWAVHVEGSFQVPRWPD